MAKNVYGKKKITRNILICVIAVLVIAAAIFLAVVLQKDGAGMNCFQRNATAASADGVKVSMSEYRLMFDMTSTNYTNSSLTDQQIRTLQEQSVRQALMQKIYIKEAKALGLTLTEEQIEACKKSADDQIESIEKYYADSLINNGNYSKTALDKQIESYYQHLGMGKDAYRAYAKESAEAEYYLQALDTYYKENGSGISEEELMKYYRESSEKSKTKTAEDGSTVSAYEQGQFWYALMLYRYGMAMPMSYVPEGFFYIDFIKLQKDSKVEISEIISKVESGELSFDELMESEDNKDEYRSFLPGPYAIGEGDHTQLFPTQAAYQIAAGLELGEIGSYVQEPETNEDGTETITAYLFRRANGTMCVEGDTGLINIDYFQGVRSYYEDAYRNDQWLSDLKIEDVVYAYKGVLR